MSTRKFVFRCDGLYYVNSAEFHSALILIRESNRHENTTVSISDGLSASCGLDGMVSSISISRILDADACEQALKQLTCRDEPENVIKLVHNCFLALGFIEKVK